MNVLKPHFTQIPNIVLDEYMSTLSRSGFIVLMAICRKTYGFHKTKDRISLSQLRLATGFSSKTIIKSLEELEKCKLLILTRKEGYTTKIEINFDGGVETTHVKKLHRTHVETTHPPVKKLHRQNKELNKVLNKDSETSSEPFILIDYAKKMKEDKQPHISLIGHYLLKQAEDFDLSHLKSKELVYSVIAQNVREAKKIVAFEKPAINVAFQEVRKDAEYGKAFEWKLSTVRKKLIR